MTKWFSTRGKFATQVTIGDIWEHVWFLYMEGGGKAIGLQWVEVRGPSKHPTMQREAKGCPHNQESLA